MAALDPNSFQYTLFLSLTIILLIVKTLLTLYILRKILEKKKETGQFKIDFVFGMFILFICLIISRVIYIYFDFFLTYFDSEVYYKHVLYWKLGFLPSAVGLAVVNYILDKKILNFKLKGITAYMILGGAILVLFWPVNSQEEFQTISAISFISSAGTILIPIIFIYLGIKIPGLRKTAFMITIGFAIYALGPILVNDAILDVLRTAYGEEMHVIIFFLFITLKIIGLIIISYSVTKFRLV